MDFLETKFEGLYLIQFQPKGDERGWFMRTFSEDLFKKNIAIFDSRWVQMNHSFNAEKGTWRGLHFQKPPFQETKAVRCISGAVIDYVVDIRENSPTFLKSYSVELSSENKKMLYIPKGFAHGFLTMENNTELVYLHDEFYSPEYEDGLRYNDPVLDIKIENDISNISPRDMNHTLLTTQFKGY
jgi:dTDP-4-dehydrorhamnose 3,5-epimerase